jgi:hypothetical protein
MVTVTAQNISEPDFNKRRTLSIGIVSIADTWSMIYR